jgi:hypothetical protein
MHIVFCFSSLSVPYVAIFSGLSILYCPFVISNVYVCNNEEKNDFLYDKLNKSYTYMTEISLAQIQMHICEWAVDLLLLNKWNFFWLSVLLIFVLYCDRKPPTLRTTSDLMMNVQTCITDDTTNPCCMSDHYVWFNDECKNMFNW